MINKIVVNVTDPPNFSCVSDPDPVWSALIPASWSGSDSYHETDPGSKNQKSRFIRNEVKKALSVLTWEQVEKIHHGL